MVQTEIPIKRWYRPDEVALYLEERTENIYRLIKNGHIEAIRIGRKVKIMRSELERLIAKGTKCDCH